MTLTDPASTRAVPGHVSFDRAGRHLTAYLSGELDAASVPGIEEAIGRHMRPDDERLWMDMAAVTFCDSSGIKLLFSLHQRCESERSRFVVYSPSNMVQRVLDLCDPTHVLAVRR